MSDKQSASRWQPEEEAWLYEQIVEDGGRSRQNKTYETWRKSLVHRFQKQFPRVQHEGEPSVRFTERRKDIPRRITRWLGNHQNKFLNLDPPAQKEIVDGLRAPKRQKRARVTNARDMAKAEDPECRQKWQALHTQFKAGQISKTEMFAQHNHFVNDRLQDPVLLERFTGMAQEKVLVESSTQASEPATRVSSVPQQELQRIMFDSSSLLPTVQTQNEESSYDLSPVPDEHNISSVVDTTAHVFEASTGVSTSSSSLAMQPRVELLHFDFDSAWNDFLSQDPLPHARIVPETDSNDMDSSSIRTPVSYLRDMQIPQHEVVPAPFSINPTPSSPPRPQIETSSTEGLMQSSHINIRTSAASYADRYPSYPQPSNNSSLTLTRTTPLSHLQTGSLGTTSTASKPGSIEGTWYLRRVCRGQIDHIRLFAFSRNSRFIASISYGPEKVVVCDVERGGVVAGPLSVGRSVTSIACYNDGRRFAVSSLPGCTH